MTQKHEAVVRRSEDFTILDEEHATIRITDFGMAKVKAIKRSRHRAFT
jgi:hypothetical protein